MKISPYLKPERILLQIKSSNKEDIIRELADLVKSSPEIISVEKFIEDVFERENIGSTGIGNGIAIPHARSEAVKDFVIVFGRSDAGINFSAIDNHPVNLFFLMGTPKEKNINGYLKILAHLSRLLTREALRDALIKAPTAEDIIKEFEKVEK
jgi:fructose-specific phosphotransferase system IIA component